MEFLETGVVVVHVLVSLGLIGLVMMQQGKGADAGASFGGGASQTVFGSQGSGSFMTKLTKYFAIVFFATSMSLAIIAKEKAEVAADQGISLAPAVESQVSGASVEEGEGVEKVIQQLELEAGDESSFATELE